MTTLTVPGPHSGAAMDRPLARPRSRRLWQAGAAVGVAALAFVAWQTLPRGVPLRLADVDIATVQPGVFHDVLISRATVQPLHSVLLDAAEDGRVEAVLAKDGATVEAGQLLFVLASAQRAQQLMARSSEAAQQLANLATFRAQWVAAQAALRRELTQANFELARAQRAQQRNVELGATGFVSAAALDESADRLAQARKLRDQLQADGQEELATRGQSVQAMARAVGDLDKGLAAMRAASDGLAVRAPVTGRLTGLALQIGESVRAGTHIARIDSSGRFKLSTRVDEFHLPRIAVGLSGTLSHAGQTLPLTVSRIDPQVKDGRFSVELNFDAEPPTGMQVGQSLDLRLTLGQPQAALLLKDGAFYADTGGSWAFVLKPDSPHAERRNVQLGRRAGGQIEVLGGLSPGERVLISSYRPFLAAASLHISP